MPIFDWYTVYYNLIIYKSSDSGDPPKWCLT